MAKHRSQAAVARLIGVSESTLSRFLSGESGISPETALEIADVGGFDLLSVLLGYDINPASPLDVKDARAAAVEAVDQFALGGADLEHVVRAIEVFRTVASEHAAAIIDKYLADVIDESTFLGELRTLFAGSPTDPWVLPRGIHPWTYSKKKRS